MGANLAAAAALAAPLTQPRRRVHAINAARGARRAAPMAAAAAASRRLLDPPRRLRQSSGSQLPRRTRASQRMVGALGAFGSGSAGGRAPPKRRLIPIPPALMSRLSMTLLLVWIARLGHFIPVPGGCTQLLLAHFHTKQRMYLLPPLPLLALLLLLALPLPWMLTLPCWHCIPCLLPVVLADDNCTSRVV